MSIKIDPTCARYEAYLKRSEQISERLLSLLYESVEFELDDADLQEIESLQREMLLNHLEAFRLN